MHPIYYGVIIFILGAIFLQGCRKIQASDPPQVGIRTFLGKITGRVVGEGWHFFLFYPWLQGFIPESVETRDQDLSKQNVRTPDQAECEISGKISWVFNPEYSRQFVDSGGDKGVEKKLENIWQGIIREWAISAMGGPQTYMDLLAATEEATDLLLKSIVRNNVNTIPSDIPTSALLKYFRKPFKGKQTGLEKKNWGAKWQKLEKFIEQEIADGRYSSEEELEKAVQKRRAIINDIRQGRGEFTKEEWGITIQHLNLTEPRPQGELATAMELEAKEEREEAADKREISNLIKRSQELQKDGNRTVEQADELFLVERGKAKKDIKKHEISLSPETNFLFKEIAGHLKKIFEK